MSYHPDRSVTETCAILNVTPPTVYKMLAQGRLQSYVVGRQRRIKAESIDRLRAGGQSTGSNG